MVFRNSHLFGNLENRASRVANLCILFLLIFFLWLQDMTARRATARNVEKEVANVGAPPQDNQALPYGN